MTLAKRRKALRKAEDLVKSVARDIIPDEMENLHEDINQHFKDLVEMVTGEDYEDFMQGEEV